MNTTNNKKQTNRQPRGTTIIEATNQQKKIIYSTEAQARLHTLATHLPPCNTAINAWGQATRGNGGAEMCFKGKVSV
jgi:hypothetical protein